MALTITQLAVLAVCVDTYSKTEIGIPVSAKYATSIDSHELLHLKLVELVRSNDALTMCPSSLGRLHILNLTKHPIY